MFANPPLSDHTNVNCCDDPLPADGVTETVLGGWTAPGTVQLPRFCQPLFSPPLFWAYREMDFVPANAGLKVRVTVNVKLFPDPMSVEPLPFTTHWLFCRVPADPTARLPANAPLSSVNQIVLLAG